MVQAQILFFKDSWILKSTDHMTLYDKFGLNRLNSVYVRTVTVLCQSNKRPETSTVKIVC